MKTLLRSLCLALVLAWAAVQPVAALAAGCSIYSNYVGKSGQTWFNEHYYGSTVPDFLEVYSKNPNITASDPSIWSKWYIRLYDKNNDIYTFKLSEKTTACTTKGGRTYITHAPGWNMNFNDAMIVVFDGNPAFSTTQEIDAYVYGNSNPPLPYNSSQKYYEPTCGALKSALDSQVSAARNKTTYSGQNLLILPNFNNKDNSRIPDGIGNWEETSEGGSGTTFTQCVTNDPVDIVKSFTWAPKYPLPMGVYSGTVDPGAVVTFTVSATNATKASMNGVTISDTLPSGLSLTGVPTASVGASVGCTGTPTTCVLTAPASLPPATTVSMTFSATVTNDPTFAGATIRNVATQSAGTTFDPPPMAEALVTVGSGLTLSLAADKNPAVYNLNELVTLTLTAENRTAYPMSGAVVRIPFPTGLTYSSGYTPIVNAGSVACDAVACVWILPATLDAGAAPTLKFKATATGSPGQAMAMTAIQTAGATLSTEPSVSAIVKMAAPLAADFNACHNYGTSNCSLTGGRLYTRVVGTAFETDVVALKKDDGTVYKDYFGAGGSAKAVKVELIKKVEGIDPASWPAIETKNTSFPTSGAAKVTVSWPALDTAYAELRVRITDSTDIGAKPWVSNDGFAVRPSAIGISTTASAGAVPQPVIKAGAPLTIVAATSPAAGYTGMLVLDPLKLTTGSTYKGNLYAAGTTDPLVLQANTVASDNASYDEVGYLDAAAGAFRDDNFTAIDQPAGCLAAGDCDCISSTATKDYLSDTLVGSTERVGCSVGNMATISFGRFKPDHFDTVIAGGMNCLSALTCPADFNGFVYSGQPFTTTITAKNASGGTTKNYSKDSYARNIVLSAWNGKGSDTPPAAGTLSPASVSESDFDAGEAVVSTTVYTLPNPYPGTPPGPTSIYLRATESEVTSRRDTASDSVEGGIMIVSGRFVVANAHGSELLRLPIGGTAQYYNGSRWVTSDTDTSEIIAPTNVLFDKYKGNLKEVKVAGGPVTTTLVGGRCPQTGCFVLDAPGAGSNGSVDVRLTSPAWLPSTTGRATFGVYRSKPIIYIREIY